MAISLQSEQQLLWVKDKAEARQALPFPRATALSSKSPETNSFRLTRRDLTTNLVQYPTLAQMTDMVCLDNLYSDALFVTGLVPVFILGVGIDKRWLGRVGKKRQLRGLC